MYVQQQSPFAAANQSTTMGNIGSSPTNDQSQSRSSSPLTPRVGRPLYSTRTIFS
ncbi:hypothetical protein BLA29_015216 [Euroglyphus maynei]|uniref:Uncharacterized protein n=1 Tax=Euroglyphus maynei TaxID=6958 RepID=A0A1Y3B178_EURMA|nr:hypothetical protein BLA29_015216 [Euroglyphus maynei]